MEKTKILYVEDEPFLAQIVQESLESRNFRVMLVRNGADAVEAFKSFLPDICVLDVMLPHKDGFTISKEIKALKSDMPVIFLTAKTQTEDLLQGFGSGGNDYLRKPFSMEELIARIHNLLRMAQNNHQSMQPHGDSEKISIGSFSFFPSLCELHGAGVVKKISHREARLLQLLINNPGKPVLRKNILLDLWGDDSFYNSRSLDVYVSRMREYFSADPTVEIVTIKGVGYHFSIKQP